MRVIPFPLLAVAMASPAAAQPAGEISTGLEFQQGDYATAERVETFSVQNSARIRFGRLLFSASLPWLRLEAPGNVVGGGGLLGLPIIVDPTRPPARDVRQGIGDLRVGAAYGLNAPAGVDLTLSGQVKLPTAAARRGLGTGETDIAFGAEVARTIGPVTPFASLSYSLPGDPAGYELRNSLSARGGVALQLAPGVRGNLSYGYAQSLSPLLEDERQISTGLNAALSRRLSLGLYGNAGLSTGSPDIGAGFQLAWRIF
jgi:hypothetical protein